MNTNVALAKNGDSAAFCKLYELYYKDMYRFAYHMLQNEQDAEDAVSETVLDAFKGIKGLRDASKFKSWIFQILTTKCKRQMAVYVSNREHLSDNEEMENLAASEQPIENKIDTTEAFKTLNANEKTVLSLMIFAGYNSREVAKIMKTREGTIRSLKARALKKLSDYMKEDYA